MIGKAALQYTSPLFFTGIRMCFAGCIILGIVCLFRKKYWIKLTKKRIFLILGLALCAIYLTNFFEFWGLQYLTSAKACFIYSLSPFIAAIFSYLQFKEKVTLKKVLGLLIGFVGFFPLFFGDKNGRFFQFSLPEVALVIATVISVYGWILLRQLRQQEGMSAMQANGLSMLIGGGMALVHSLLSDVWHPFPTTYLTHTLGFSVLLALFSNVICFNLYGYLLKQFTATFLAIAGLITPIFAALFGYLFLGETVSTTFFIAVGTLFLGLYLVYSEELKLGYIRKAKEELQSSHSVQ